MINKITQWPIPWLSLLKGLMLAGVSIVIYWSWLQTAQLLPIKQIALTGVMQQVQGAAVRDAVRPFVEKGFFSTDVAQVRDVVEAMPWVSQATVRRQWPDTLAIEVKEQRLLARWADDALINLQGELFYPPLLEGFQSVPQFNGIAGLNVVMAEQYQHYQQMLSVIALTIVRLDVSERRAWRIKLNNGVELLLGRAPQTQRLQRFIDAYQGGLADHTEQISRVDLRYSNGFAISWKENKVG